MSCLIIMVQEWKKGTSLFCCFWCWYIAERKTSTSNLFASLNTELIKSILYLQYVPRINDSKRSCLILSIVFSILSLVESQNFLQCHRPLTTLSKKMKSTSPKLEGKIWHTLRNVLSSVKHSAEKKAVRFFVARTPWSWAGVKMKTTGIY